MRMAAIFADRRDSRFPRPRETHLDTNLAEARMEASEVVTVTPMAPVQS